MSTCAIPEIPVELFDIAPIIPATCVPCSAESEELGVKFPGITFKSSWSAWIFFSKIPTLILDVVFPILKFHALEIPIWSNPHWSKYIVSSGTHESTVS